jgi:hypothetical protein
MQHASILLTAAAHLHDASHQDPKSSGIWPGDQEIEMEHLRVLMALPQLRILNLYHTRWEEDTNCTGLATLLAGLPRLRVLNGPKAVLVRTFCDC